MELDLKNPAGNKLNKNLINLYYNKTFLSKLSKVYKYSIKKNMYIDVLYYYLLWNEDYQKNTEGLCIKSTKKKHNNLENFILYYTYKTVKINQLFFKTSPFNLLYKFKYKNIKKLRRVFLL